jgi:type VI secretion system secreted protein Hcp
MELSNYLQIFCDRIGGNVEGSCIRKNHDKKIEILQVNHNLKINSTNEGSTFFGEIIHKPLQIIKHTDRSSPMLYKLLCEKITINQAVLEFFSYNKSGIEELKYKVKITNAKIVQLDFNTPTVSNSHYHHEKISECIFLSYETIGWYWGKSGDVVFETQWSKK